MESFVNHPRASLLARHRVLTALLAVLILGSAGFAAAGGVELIKSWFVTVTVNGNLIHAGKVVTDENGEATLTLPKGALGTDPLKEVTVGMEDPEGATEGQTTKTITITDGESDLAVRIGSTTPPEPSSKKE